MSVRRRIGPAHLAAVAALLAVGALAAGSPRPPATGGVDVRELARTVAREEDHVTAVELARWIRDRRPGLRVIDVRDARAFDEYHVPGAERRTVEELATLAVSPDETVVLYSEGGTHAAQGWFLLRARGLSRVWFLRGGIYEWSTEVLDPRLPKDATPEQRRAFGEAAALSRWFGGQPSVGGPPRLPADDPSSDPARARRAYRRNAC